MENNNTKRFVNGILFNLVKGTEHMVIHDQEYGLLRANGIYAEIRDKDYDKKYQCIIKFVEKKCMIYDNFTNTGTYIDNIQLLKGPENAIVLKNADVIRFGNKKYMKYFYKFRFCPYDVNLGEDEKRDEEVKQIEEMRHSLKKILSGVIKIQTLLSNNKQVVNVKTRPKTKNVHYFDAIRFKKLVEKLEKQRKYAMKLSINLQDFLSQCEEQSEVTRLFKTDIINALTNHLQCAICNEVVVEASTTVCGHIFCEDCLSKWLIIKMLCPVCRSLTRTVIQCFAVNEFIRNVFDIFGGTIKIQRSHLWLQRYLNRQSINENLLNRNAEESLFSPERLSLTPTIFMDLTEND